MGQHLSKTHKNNYLNIGFAFFDGQYTAPDLEAKTAKAFDAIVPNPSTYEYYLNTIPYSIWAIDLRKVEQEDIASCLKENNLLEFRQFGAVHPNDEFDYTNLIEDFDMLIFVKKSTPTSILSVK